MPEYTFQIVIILIRDEDELSIVRDSHSLYATVVMQTVYHHAKPYVDNGWKLHKYYTQNYDFLNTQPPEHD